MKLNDVKKLIREVSKGSIDLHRHIKQGPDEIDRDNTEPVDVDARAYLKSRGPVSPGRWILHMTNRNPYRIARDGFKYGTAIKGMHLTRAKEDQERLQKGPFAFGFLGNSPDVEAAQRDGSYLGSESGAVLFQSDAAILVYHNTDREEQVIFERDRTKNRIPVYYSRWGLWEIRDAKNGKRYFHNVSLRKVVQWVENNHRQYAARIVVGAADGGEKPPSKPRAVQSQLDLK